ncbi:hypothetical protein OAN94_05750 [Verrucomicrobiales bacterium]|jgi:hypothetical protein|nr:hypothetical protein [Verrucomicrobiales bacterium]MDB4467779.1 hypothetical protein [Verrucomicrobiales bacterium]MDC0503762.1 hypothetical protein [Verrucomicrobiales bacterium]MDF1787787.1 hypothetical protein [Verrucomicrobiales bacterium]
MEPNPINPDEPDGWFDRKENVRKVLVGLFIGCAVLVAIDVVFWVTGFDKHPYLKWETWPGFYAVYGFVACVLLVLISKHVLRPLVMRDEDYYKADSKGDDDA